MMDEQDHVHDLVGAYVLGAVTPVEADLVEQHLATCAACRRLERELRDVEQQLPHLGGGMTPPPELKTRLMSIVRDEARARTPNTSDTNMVISPEPAQHGATAQQEAPPVTPLAPAAPIPIGRRPARLTPLLAIAAALILVVGGVAVWHALTTGSSSKPSLYATMVGTPALPTAAGKVYYDKSNHQLSLALQGLKAIPSNRVYELWLVHLHGKTIVGFKGIGVFRPSPDGRGHLTLTVPDVTSYNLAGVTIERAPRAATPTFPMVAAGNAV